MDNNMLFLLCAVCVFWGCHAVMDSSAAASWTFTKSNGGRDLSEGGGNPFELTNVEYGPGPNGEPNGAVILPYSLDQSMIVIDPTDKLRFYDGMTFFTYVYINGTTQGPLFEYNTGTSEHGVGGNMLWVGPDSTSLKVELNTGFNIEANDVLVPHTWQKIAVVWNTDSLSFYINGRRRKQAGEGLNLTKTMNGHLHVGHRPGDDSNMLKGSMACAKFYNWPLSRTQVRALSCDEDVRSTGDQFICHSCVTSLSLGVLVRWGLT